MRTPTSLQDAKAIYREEKAKVTSSFNTLIGSRIVMAVLATLVVTFGVTLIFAPGDLPPVGGLSLARIGLPPVDCGIVCEQAQEALSSAYANGAPETVKAFVADNGKFIPALNAGVFALALALLLVNMTIMTKRRRITRG